MKEIKINEELYKICKNINLGCIYYNTTVENSGKEFWDYIDSKVITNIQQTISLENLSEQSNIKESRQAYKNIGKDPSRYRVSSEALIRRILQGKGLYKINNVVDVNNLISMESKYSVGSYDIEKLGNNLEFRIGNKDEQYKGIGKEFINIENLPVFSDETGAYGSPTSDSERAMITSNSKEILTVVISFSGKIGLEEIINKATEYLIKFANAKNIETKIV